MKVEQLNLFGDVVQEFFDKHPYDVEFSDYGREIVDRWLVLFKEQKFEELAEINIITQGHSNAYYLSQFKKKIGVTNLASDLDKFSNCLLFVSQLEAAYQKIVS